MRNSEYRFKTILTLILLGYGMQMLAQTKLIEKVTRKGSEIVIPYEKYQLMNGLTLLIHEDHSDPIVYVGVMYHVGSAREQEGRSGFAHFFEHMMFEGSEHVPSGQHAKIITEAGGINNGNTTHDRTNYWELLPSNYLETALWLESDRMGFFVNAVTQEKFEIQRKTVKNERSERIDNRPFGLIDEKTSEVLYPPSHPYSWPVIGYVSDLDKVSVTDLKDFFNRWYGPNNATLTIAGDVNPAQVVMMVEKYFGSIPSGPTVKRQEISPVVLDQNRYISYEDRVRLSQVIYTFPTVQARHPDEPALDVLANLLGEGKSSVFYQYFVKSGDAEYLNISHPCLELAGEFKIRIFANRLNQLDKMIKEAFEEFEKKGVTDEDLSKLKMKFESDRMNQLQSIRGKGDLLAFYQTNTGNPNFISNDFDRYSKVTKEDVMRVYKAYIKDKYSVITTAYQKNNPPLNKVNKFSLPVKNLNPTEGNEYKNLTYKKPKDNFDRNKQPFPNTVPIVKVPDFWIDSLTNSLKIIGTKSDELPTIHMKISIPIGHRFEDKNEEGISELVALMLKESTTKNTSEKIDLKLNLLGSHINVVSEEDEMNIYVTSLTKNFDSTLAIVEEMLIHPKFDRDEFERIQLKQVGMIRNGANNPETFPTQLIKKLIYGKNHILGNSSWGSGETVSQMSASKVKEYYEKNCIPSLTSIVFVGNLNKEDVITKLAFLKNWKNPKVLRSKINDSEPIEKTIIYFLNNKNSTQSQIRLGCKGLPFDATGEFYKSLVATYVLAEPFSSRLNLNLREQHGYCYRASSSFEGNEYSGEYIIEANVKSASTDSALIEIMNEIKKYSDNGISKEEFLFARNSLAQEEALKYETPPQKADFLKTILDYSLTKDFPIKQNELLKNISLDEINALAKKRLPYNNMIILIIGDKEKAYNQLARTGYEIKEINFEGRVLNSN